MTASIVPFDRKVTDEEIKEYVTACTDVAMRLDEYIQRVDEAYYQISVASRIRTPTRVRMRQQGVRPAYADATDGHVGARQPETNRA